MEKRQMFGEILQGKALSDRTIKEYLYYYDLLQRILEGTHRDLDQEVLNVFVSSYNNSPCRAFLKIYLEEEKRDDLKMPVRSGSRPQKKRQYISPEEVSLVGNWILRFVGNPRYFLMLHLTYECALRRKEVGQIQPSDFNWDVWLKDPEQRGKLKITIKGAKRKKERYVIVPSWLMKGLYAYIADIHNKLDDEDTLFEISDVRWHQIFKKAVRTSLNKNFSLHDLRFSKATSWYRNGLDIRQIKIRLGHSRIETTYRYIDPAEEEELETWHEHG
jgi:integrase